MPKPTNIAQLHSIARLQFNRMSTKVCRNSPKLDRIRQTSFHERAPTLNTQRVALICFCLVRVDMPLLIWLSNISCLAKRLKTPLPEPVFNWGSCSCPCQGYVCETRSRWVNVLSFEKGRPQGKISTRDQKRHDSQRHDRILRFSLRPEIGQVSPHFGAICLLNCDLLAKLHRKLGEKGKNTGETQKSQWRRHPEIADFCPLSWTSAS